MGFLSIAAAVAAAVVLWLVSIYNKLVRLRNTVKWPGPTSTCSSRNGSTSSPTWSRP